jgi:hypothetical protein
MSKMQTLVFNWLVRTVSIGSLEAGPLLSVFAQVSK